MTELIQLTMVVHDALGDQVVEALIYSDNFVEIYFDGVLSPEVVRL
jgi:hypothetical protein